MRRRTFLKAALAAVALAASGASLALRAAVAEICSKARPLKRAIKLPPLPKWNKTTDDIDSHDFLRRLQDYKRSQLPPSTVFPRTGQIWETVCDCEVHVIKWMIGPTVPKVPVLRLDARLRQGERVRILTLDDPKPLTVAFQPLRYEELHQNIAPDSLRYELRLRTAGSVLAAALREDTGYFNEVFRLVEDVA